MSSLALSDSFEYLCFGSTAIIYIKYIYNILTLSVRRQSSESDVYRRQILTTKVDPRTAMVKDDKYTVETYISFHKYKT